MPIYRNKQSKDFTTLPNALLQNRALSYHARGLLAYLLSRPTDWNIHVTEMITTHDGVRTVRTALKELRQSGYIILAPRHEEGHIRQWVYEVYDHAQNVDSQNVQVRNVEVRNAYHTKDLNLQTQKTEKNKELKKEEPPIVPLGGRTQKSTRLFRNYSAAFEAWWAAYPSSRRTAKPKCYALWQQEALDGEVVVLVAKLERLKDTVWNGCEIKFIPLALTYLSQGRFDDDLLPAYDPRVNGVLRDPHTAKQVAGAQRAMERLIAKHATKESIHGIPE